MVFSFEILLLETAKVNVSLQIRVYSILYMNGRFRRVEMTMECVSDLVFSFECKYLLNDSEWKIHSAGVKNLSDSAITLLFKWNFTLRSLGNNLTKY